jgi:hypothetical protein
MPHHPLALGHVMWTEGMGSLLSAPTYIGRGLEFILVRPNVTYQRPRPWIHEGKREI